VTPYVHHYYIEVLIKYGLLEEARLAMDEYWVRWLMMGQILSRNDLIRRTKMKAHMVVRPS